MRRSVALRILPLLILGLATIRPALTLEVVSPPSLIMNPNATAPLAGVVEVSTDVASRVTLHVDDGVDPWIVSFPELAASHAVPLLGLKADDTYSVTVMVTDEAGQTVAAGPPLDVITDPLPADFPEIVVLVSDPAGMEPGLTLLDKFTRARGSTIPAYSIIVDHAGQPVWYSPLGASATLRLPSGNLLYRSGNTATEIDLLGAILQQVPLADPYDGLHHDLFPTVDGTYLSLSRRPVFVEGYPSSETDPTAPTQDANIEDDPVVEFAADGTLLDSWSLTDMLDPTRIGYKSLDPDDVLGFDWGHANAVWHDPTDDSILVSVRHQDAVVKFSRSTGELIWILGPHDNWSAEFQPYLLQPVGSPFFWQFHEHAMMITPAGTLGLYDNGNFRASPFDGREPVAGEDNHSRAVEYEIDETNMTVRQVWHYAAPHYDRVYAGSRGDADWLPITGNVLITHAAIEFTGGVASCDLLRGSRYAKIIEVDHGTPAEKVFEMEVFDPTTPGGECPQIVIYRSERIPGLYPSDVTLLRGVELDLTPEQQLVPRGGKLSISATATNSTATEQCVDLWAGLAGRGRDLGPAVQLCVGPFASETLVLEPTLPARVPVGIYQIEAFAGSYPAVLSADTIWVAVTP